MTQANNNLLGTHPAGIPRNTASLWARYDFSSRPLRGLTTGAGIRYVGSSFGDSVNTFSTNAFTVVDALVRYDFANLRPELKGYQLSLNVNNLFDQIYVSACYGAGSNCFYGLRRSIVVTLQYRW